MPWATSRGQMCGAIGDIGCFSFFANKNLSTAEGGMIVTNNDRLAERRSLRSHGMTASTWDRHQGHAHSYDVVERGFNYRLDELRAAIGLVELRRLHERNAARARIVEQYRVELHGIQGLQLPFRDDEIAAHHLAVVLPDGAFDAFRACLASSESRRASTTRRSTASPTTRASARADAYRSRKSWRANSSPCPCIRTCAMSMSPPSPQPR